MKTKVITATALIALVAIGGAYYMQSQKDKGVNLFMTESEEVSSDLQGSLFDSSATPSASFVEDEDNAEYLTSEIVSCMTTAKSTYLETNYDLSKVYFIQDTSKYVAYLKSVLASNGTEIMTWWKEEVTYNPKSSSTTYTAIYNCIKATSETNGTTAIQACFDAQSTDSTQQMYYLADFVGTWLRKDVNPVLYAGFANDELDYYDGGTYETSDYLHALMPYDVEDAYFWYCAMDTDDTYFANFTRDEKGVYFASGTTTVEDTDTEESVLTVTGSTAVKFGEEVTYTVTPTSGVTSEYSWYFDYKSAMGTSGGSYANGETQKGVTQKILFEFVPAGQEITIHVTEKATGAKGEIKVQVNPASDTLTLDGADTINVGEEVRYTANDAASMSIDNTSVVGSAYGFKSVVLTGKAAGTVTITAENKMTGMSVTKTVTVVETATAVGGETDVSEEETTENTTTTTTTTEAETVLTLAVTNEIVVGYGIEVRVSSTTSKDSQYKYEVTNAAGSVVYSETLDCAGGSCGFYGKHQMETAGAYTFKITGVTSGKTATQTRTVYASPVINVTGPSTLAVGEQGTYTVQYAEKYPFSVGSFGISISMCSSDCNGGSYYFQKISETTIPATSTTGYGVTYVLKALKAGTASVQGNDVIHDKTIGKLEVAITESAAAATNGACGSAANNALQNKPVASLCSAGTSSEAVLNSDSTKWEWTCTGVNGGTTASCSTAKKTVCTGNYYVGGSANTSTKTGLGGYDDKLFWFDYDNPSTIGEILAGDDVIAGIYLLYTSANSNFVEFSEANCPVVFQGIGATCTYYTPANMLLTWTAEGGVTTSVKVGNNTYTSQTDIDTLTKMVQVNNGGNIRNLSCQ